MQGLHFAGEGTSLDIQMCRPSGDEACLGTGFGGDDITGSAQPCLYFQAADLRVCYLEPSPTNADIFFFLLKSHSALPGA